jgi:hypothetical protein
MTDLRRVIVDSLQVHPSAKQYIMTVGTIPTESQTVQINPTP